MITLMTGIDYVLGCKAHWYSLVQYSL